MPEENKTSAIGKKGWVILSLIGVLAVLSMLGLLRENINKQRFEDELQKIRAAGLPATGEELMDWETPPDAENGAEYFIQAVLEYEKEDTPFYHENKISISDFLKGDSEAVSTVSPMLTGGNLTRKFYSKHTKEINDLIDNKLKPYFRLLNKSLNYKHLYFNCKYNKGFDAELNNFMETRTAAVLLSGKTKRDIYINKNTHNALRTNQQQLKLASKLTPAKSFIEGLVELAIYNIASNNFQIICLETRPEPEQLKETSQTYFHNSKLLPKMFFDCTVGEKAICITSLIIADSIPKCYT